MLYLDICTKAETMIKTFFNLTFLVGLFLLLSCDDDEPMETVTPPEACFEVSEATVKTGEEVSFSNCSKNATEYLWDFGDGTSSTEKEPSHVYPSAGSYTVKLLAGTDTDSDGVLEEGDEADATTESIRVNALVISMVFTIKDGTSWTMENPTLADAEGATVNLFGSQGAFDNGTPDFTATSNADGNVVFNDLENGTYFLVVSKNDLGNLIDNFLIDGVFQTQEEIDGGAIHPGTPQPGDFKLADINGDGLITDDDKASYQFLEYSGELINLEIVIGK